MVALSMNQPFWAAYRTRVLAPARGRVLEIGFGSGANLRFYPPEVDRLEVVEPDGAFTALAQREISDSRIKIELHEAVAESLPFEDDTFDTVVSTLTLCSVTTPDRCLAEVGRVLKPGGRFLFMEHGLADESGVRRWQNRLNRLTRSLACGCHLNRDISEIIRGAGFRYVHMKEDYIRGMPKFGGLLSEGYAEA